MSVAGPVCRANHERWNPPRHPMTASCAKPSDRSRSPGIFCATLLRYYVQGTRQLDEPAVRALLQETGRGEPLMQTFLERYIAQGEQRGLQLGEQRGSAAVLLRQIERRFGPADEPLRAHCRRRCRHPADPVRAHPGRPDARRRTALNPIARETDEYDRPV